MNPPTPYPASAKSRSNSQIESRQMAFREITARTNSISKSVQDSFTGIKKQEEEQTGKSASKTPTASRRYSVASKFAVPKADNSNNVSNGTPALQSKNKLSKRASFQGGMSESQILGTSIQVSSTSGRNSAIQASKYSKGIAAPSLQANLLRRQSLAYGQASKPYKPTTDSFKRSAPGCGKTDSTHAQTNKAGGMLLKSACYWLEQIKLAEIMEKFGVSIGFFRLAVECGAEPIGLLRDELIAFIGRYSLWSETIQQLLLCYGVATEVQGTLFSNMSSCGVKQPFPEILGKSHEGDCLATEELEVQASEKHRKSSDQDVHNASGEDLKDPTGDTIKVAKEVLQEVLVPDKDLQLGMTGHPIDIGHIKSMDAESITRQVVSCIMSSMHHSDGCRNGNLEKYNQPKNDVSSLSAEQYNHSLGATEIAANGAVSVHESISIPNSAFLGEASATSSDSLPSLSAWNSMPENSATCCQAAQEEVTLILDNDMNDSTSTSRVSGEGMSVSMELVDTLSDDVQSSNPNGLASVESKCHASYTTDEVHGTVLEAVDVIRNSDDEAMPPGQDHDIWPQSSIHSRGQKETSGKIQISENCRMKCCKDHKNKNASSKARNELPALQMVSEPDTQVKRRLSHGIGGRCESGKEKAALVSDKTNSESPVSIIDKATTSGTLASRRLSISTPRSSTSAHTSKLDASSKTRSKGRLSQSSNQGSESHHTQLRNPVAESDGNLETPKLDRRVEVGDGPNQLSLNVVDGMNMQTTDSLGLSGTPGSAGVRRSARLLKPVGVSTPSSVSTPRLQRQIGTPKNAQK